MVINLVNSKLNINQYLIIEMYILPLKRFFGFVKTTVEKSQFIFIPPIIFIPRI